MCTQWTAFYLMTDATPLSTWPHVWLPTQTHCWHNVTILYWNTQIHSHTRSDLELLQVGPGPPNNNNNFSRFHRLDNLCVIQPTMCCESTDDDLKNWLQPEQSPTGLMLSWYIEWLFYTLALWNHYLQHAPNTIQQNQSVYVGRSDVTLTFRHKMTML